MTRTSFVFVLFGPGGVGKGTVAHRLVAEVPDLWLSRSWTTRDQRPGEPDGAYVFVSHDEFEQHRAAAGFLEWAESTPGNLYGTPVPDPPAGVDLLLEIDAQGAQQVQAHRPDSVLWFLDAPSDQALEDRMRGRGDIESRIAQRLDQARVERNVCRALGAPTIVNDDLDETVAEFVRRIDQHRREHR